VLPSHHSEALSQRLRRQAKAWPPGERALDKHMRSSLCFT